jgi:hypothetical protein
MVMKIAVTIDTLKPLYFSEEGNYFSAFTSAYVAVLWYSSLINDGVPFMTDVLVSY